MISKRDLQYAIKEKDAELTTLREWAALADLVCPQGPQPRAATPDDVRRMVKTLLDVAHTANGENNTLRAENVKLRKLLVKWRGRIEGPGGMSLQELLHATDAALQAGENDG